MPLLTFEDDEGEMARGDVEKTNVGVLLHPTTIISMSNYGRRKKDSVSNCTASIKGENTIRIR